MKLQYIPGFPGCRQTLPLQQCWEGVTGLSPMEGGTFRGDWVNNKTLNFCQNTGGPGGVSPSRCEKFDNFIFKMVQSGAFQVYLCISGQFSGEFRRI